MGFFFFLGQSPRENLSQCWPGKGHWQVSLKSCREALKDTRPSLSTQSTLGRLWHHRGDAELQIVGEVGFSLLTSSVVATLPVIGATLVAEAADVEPSPTLAHLQREFRSTLRAFDHWGSPYALDTGQETYTLSLRCGFLG